MTEVVSSHLSFLISVSSSDGGGLVVDVDRAATPSFLPCLTPSVPSHPCFLVSPPLHTSCGSPRRSATPCDAIPLLLCSATLYSSRQLATACENVAHLACPLPWMPGWLAATQEASLLYQPTFTSQRCVNCCPSACLRRLISWDKPFLAGCGRLCLRKRTRERDCSDGFCFVVYLPVHGSSVRV